MDENTQNQVSFPNMDNLERLAKTLNEFTKISMKSISPQLKNSLETFSKLPKFDINLYSYGDSFSKLFEVVNSYKNNQFFNNISSVLNSLDLSFEFSIPKDIKDESVVIEALSHLKDENWPYFLMVSDLNASQILAYKSEELEHYFYQICDKKFIDDLVDDWQNDKNLIDERKRIINEACDCYLDGKYAACVSILACQYDGLIDEIEHYIEDNNISFDQYEFECLYNEFCPNTYTNKNTEKKKIVKAISTVDEGCLVWWSCCDYLINEVYANKPNYKKMNPNRNKICHGEQLDFFDKKHALKSILVTDMLIKLKTKIIKANSSLEEIYGE